jgi:hypothetical protein
MKIDATPESWTERARFLNGTSVLTRYRWDRNILQEWVEQQKKAPPPARGGGAR